MFPSGYTYKLSSCLSCRLSQAYRNKPPECPLRKHNHTPSKSLLHLAFTGGNESTARPRLARKSISPARSTIRANKLKSSRDSDLHVLSTPPAFILSQIKLSDKVFESFTQDNRLAISRFTALVCLNRSLNVKKFSRIVCVSLFSYQGLLRLSLRQLVYFISSLFVCQALF